MRGKNTTAMKSPWLLRAFFSKLALSSPPERFLQIPVWGIVNTNFSLLKSPHIPAMLSFECRTQGRPLNSFIAGFKTLHFKKYKSYSQMNEGGGGGDWREGLLMCPVGRHELNLSPQAAQIHSPVRWLLCPRDPALHTWHPFTSFDFLQNTHIRMQTQHRTIRVIVWHDNEKCYNSSRLLLTNFKMSTPAFTSLYFHFFERLTPRDRFLTLSSHTSDFSLFPNTLERKVFSPWAERKHSSCAAARLKWYCINKSCHLLFAATWRRQSEIWC